MMKFLFGLFIGFLSISVCAQEFKIPHDTSFTVYSSFIKEKKNYPFIKIAKPALPDGVLTLSNIIYRTIGKRKLAMDICYPSKKLDDGYPAVLLIHGGGWRSGDKSQCVPIAQALAGRGYVVMSVEYRLSPEEKYPAAVYDLKAAIRWMRANASLYNINPQKIAAMGFSAGGQLAALLGTTGQYNKLDGEGENKSQSSAVQAVVDVDGILAFKHPESEEGASAAAWLGGTYEQKPDAWEEASALTHTDENTPPILFINSSLPRFHAGRDDMIKKLNKLNICSEVKQLPETPHPFWLFHPWFDPTVDFTIVFLDKVFHVTH